MYNIVKEWTSSAMCAAPFLRWWWYVRDSLAFFFLAHENVILLSARSMIFLKTSRPNTACILAGSTLDLCSLSGLAI